MTSEVSAILRETWSLNVEARADEFRVNNTDYDRILVPAVIRTTEGDALFTKGDEIWRLSAHMDGYTPSPEKAELSPIVANGLGLLHSKLRKVPISLAVTSRWFVFTR